MIKGTGIDIVEVDRIKRSLEKNDGFSKAVFSKQEIEYCESRGNKFESYAGKFAAKEAFFKALGTGWSGKMNFYEVIVLNNALGKPEIRLEGEALNFFKNNPAALHVSVSHTKNYATAIVILEE
ncbi:MAG: holo-ACP synthase [Candidatus Cyclobacteriaceae bacterium M2_1C_046]